MCVLPCKAHALCGGDNNVLLVLVVYCCNNVYPTYRERKRSNISSWSKMIHVLQFCLWFWELQVIVENDGISIIIAPLSGWRYSLTIRARKTLNYNLMSSFMSGYSFGTAHTVCGCAVLSVLADA